MKGQWITLAVALAVTSILGAACQGDGSPAGDPKPAKPARAELAPAETAMSARDHLSSWVKAHNAGDEVSLATWIEQSYSPELLDKLNIEEHIAFYQGIIQDFGALYPEPIAEIESSRLRLVVHLRPAAVANPDPFTTLVVEIDLDSEDTHYLKRGLGLGALVCEVDKR
jgi:hypothetical protein